MKPWNFFFLILLSILLVLATVFVMQAIGQEQGRTIILSAHKPAFQYTEAFLYSDSAEIKVNGKFLRYKPIRGRAVIGEVFGKGKKYKDGLTADKGGGADILRVVDGNKIKETVVVNDTSIHSYKYVLNTNMSISKVGNYIYLDSTVGYIAPPVGWDADSNAVNVTFELSGDTITYSWSKTDSAVTMNYPVSIDPTVIFNYNDSEDDPMIQSAGTTNYGSLDQIHMRGDSAGNDMGNGWIRFDIDSVAFTDSVASAKLFFTSKQANFNGAVEYSVHLVKVGLPVESEITWNIWKTSNNWNLAGARGGNDIYYSDPSPVTGHSFNAGGAGIADSVDITTLVRKIAGKDSSLANYGFLLLVTTRGNGNTIYYASSEHATAAYRPYLKVTTVSTASPLCTLSVSIPSRYDTITFSITGDTASIDSARGYKIVGTDTLAVTANYTGGYNNVRFDSASQKTTYILIAKFWDAGVAYWTNKDTILTPWSPSAPSLTMQGRLIYYDKLFMAWTPRDSATSYILAHTGNPPSYYDTMTTTADTFYNDVTNQRNNVPPATGAAVTTDSVGRIRVTWSQGEVDSYIHYYKVLAKNIHGYSAWSAVEGNYSPVQTYGPARIDTAHNPTGAFSPKDSGSTGEWISPVVWGDTIRVRVLTKTNVTGDTAASYSSTVKGYAVPPTITLSVAAGTSYDTIVCSIGGYTSYFDSAAIYKIVGTDTLKMTAFNSSFATLKVDSANRNTNYILIAKALYRTTFSNKDTILTGTYVLTLSYLTDSTASLTITAAASGDTVAIIDSIKTIANSDTVFRNASGDSALTAVYRQANAWSITVDELLPDTINAFSALDKSPSAVGASDTTWTDPAEASLTASAQSNRLIKLWLDPDDNPSYTAFGVYDSVNAQYLKWSTGLFSPDTSWETWGTYNQWGADMGYTFPARYRWYYRLYPFSKRSN